MKNHGQSKSNVTRALADAQIAHALANPRDTGAALESAPTVYRLYVENVYKAFWPYLTANGFHGATIFSTSGIWQDSVEPSNVVEVIATWAERSAFVRFAADVCEAFDQKEVLVTFTNARVFQSVTVYNHARQ